nr:MAG TPA_asm: hypothetical protein [Bacteriophage sp.]
MAIKWRCKWQTLANAGKYWQTKSMFNNANY